MQLKINWKHKRCRHALERMWLRGISLKEIEEGITKGKRIVQKKTKLFESFFRDYSIVYDEKLYKKINIRKIFPITVKLW